MYRETKKAKKFKAMRAAKERKRLEGPAPDYPPDLPNLRRVITVTDYDTGEPVTHTIELYKSNRIDCYRAVVDGAPWKDRIGWSKILAGLRKALPRVGVFSE
jgi:hypothetical protein